MYTNIDMKKIFGTIAATVLLALPVIAFFQPFTVHGQTTIAPTLENPIKYDNFSDFVAAVTKAAVNILLPFVVLAFIYSGFLFVKAKGNEKELETAKSAIKWSVVGAFILFGAWGFAQIISTTVTSITK